MENEKLPLGKASTNSAPSPSRHLRPVGSSIIETEWLGLGDRHGGCVTRNKPRKPRPATYLTLDQWSRTELYLLLRVSAYFRAKNNSDKRGSVNVRFAPKATELLRCREFYAFSKAPRPAERWADSGPGRARRATCVKRVMPRELCPKSFPPPSFRLAPSAREPLANTVSECEANDQHDCSFQH